MTPSFKSSKLPAMPADPPFTVYLAQFRVYQRRRNLSPLTIKNRDHTLTLFAFHLAASTPRLSLFTARPADVDMWLDSRAPSASTRRAYLSSVSSFYAWAIRDGLTEINPVAAIERPRQPRRLPRPIDDADLAHAMASAEPRMYAWLCLSAYQGFRCIEISRLQWEDVDFRRRTVLVHGKGDKDRVISLHESTIEALTRYRAGRVGGEVAPVDSNVRSLLLERSTGYVFPRDDGGRLSENTVSRYIGTYLRGLGIASSAHRNRHWFVTKLVENTGDLLLAAEMAGHESVETTRIYARLLTAKGASAINDLRIS